jgi:hypothetical protein
MYQRSRSFWYFLLALAWFPLVFHQGLPAQTSANTSNPLAVKALDRITGTINEQQRIVLQGQVHPLAQPQFDQGAVPADLAMSHMLLTLSGSPAQEAAVAALLDGQRNPKSPLYRQWLTPAQFGEHFGVSVNDLAKIQQWLQSHGFQVDEVGAGQRSLTFSGTAAQVQAAFHTAIHRYLVNSVSHYANATAPAIPAALAGVVVGVASLNDFYSAPQYTTGTGGTTHRLTPVDLATIYDVTPLYGEGLDGTGQHIAVVGRADINLSDISTFRSSFGLPANPPTIIHPGASPGSANVADATEATVDVEWAGALAKNAQIIYVPAASTSASDGIYLSAQYIVDNNLAPVVTVSYGVCESALGTAGNLFVSSLWEQAASQGMSVFVSAGDTGAAGCDAPSSTTATGGAAVNGLCSTPYNVCVGGTQFNDTANPGLYWNSANASTTQASARSYIPETVWNESGINAGKTGLSATGGGASIKYSKPGWQLGLGVPNDNYRHVPDVALDAAAHDGYLIYFKGTQQSASGTSLAAPSWASIMALLVQNYEPQGNPNARFYSLANQQQAGGPAVFHDITSGNNSVPGQTGFSAAKGYDQATGLGTVDALALVNHWADPIADDDTLGLTIQLSPTSQSIAAGKSGTAITVTASVTGTPENVTFSATNLPNGVSAVFTPPNLTPPGTSSLVLTATTSAVNVTSSPVSITGTPDSYPTNDANSATLTLTTTGGTYVTISKSPVAAAAVEGKTTSFTVTATGSPTALTYQWFSQAPGGSATPIAGATAASYTTPKVTLANDQTAYWVVVANSATSATSSSALLTVTPAPPVITAQPVSQTVLTGSPATFVVGDSGEPGTAYQWQVCSPLPTSPSTFCANTLANVNWVTITGANSSSYTTGALTSTNNGWQYRVLLTDSLCVPAITGSTTLISSAATATVYYVTAATPASKSVTEGATATFTVTASGNPATFTYQWYVLPPGGANQLILGATSASYTTAKTTMAMNGTKYSVVVSNSAATTTTGQATLTVTAGVPVILTQPASQTVLANGTNKATFTVADDGLHGTITNYAWKVKKSGASAFSAVGTSSASYQTPVLDSTYNNAQYEVILTNAAGTTTSSTATLTVTYLNITTEPNSPSAADGKSATFSVVAAGNPSTLTYQWYSGMPGSGTLIANATSASLTVSPVTNSQNGAKYFVVVTNSATSLHSTAGTLTVTPPGPGITDQPQNQAVLVGNKATFTVVPTLEASAPTITYQWQVSTNNGITWNSILHATSASYQTSATTITANGNQYRVLLTDTTGTTTSAAATLSVQYITINTQPAALTLQQNNSATFVVSATGNPGLSYQWYSRANSSGTSAPISGAIHSSYTIPSVTTAQDGTLVKVVVSNAATQVTSNEVSLSVTAGAPAAPAFTTSPASQSAVGGAASFSVVATGTPTPTLKWQQSTNGGVSFTDIPGATSSTYAPTGLTTTNDQTQYRAVATNTMGVANSSAATLSVSYISSQPQATTGTVGSTASFSVTLVPNTGTPTYQWQKWNGSAWVSVPAGGSGDTTASYTTTTLANADDQTQYRVQLTYSNVTINSSAAVLTVNQISSQPVSTTVNTGSTATFTVTATGTPTAYAWQKCPALGSCGVSGPDWTSVGTSSNSYTTPKLASSDDGSQYRVTVTYGSVPIVSSPATLSVNYINSAPQPTSGIQGGTAAFAVGANNAPLSYQWRISTNGGATWNNVSTGTGGASSAYTTATLGSVDNSDLFDVVLTYPQGQIASDAVMLTVYYINTQPNSPNVNTGATASFFVAASGGTPTYQWQVYNGTAWANVSTGSGGTTNNYTTAALSSANDQTLYRVLVGFGGLGSITSNPGTVTVNYTSIGTAPSGTSVPTGGTAKFFATATGEPGTLTYTWYKVGSGTPLATHAGIASGTQDEFDYGPVVAGDNNAQFYVSVSNAVGAVTTDTHLAPATLTVLSSSPTITGGTSGAVTYNLGDTPTFSVSANNAAGYAWEVCNPLPSTDCTKEANFTAAPGTNNASTYTPPAFTMADDQNWYHVVVTNGNGSSTSTAIVVTVNYVEVTDLNADVEVLAGDTVKYSVTAVGTNGTTLTYTWYQTLSGQSPAAITSCNTVSSPTCSITAASNMDNSVVYVVVTNGLTVANPSNNNPGPGQVTSDQIPLFVF